MAWSDNVSSSFIQLIPTLMRVQIPTFLRQRPLFAPVATRGRRYEAYNVRTASLKEPRSSLKLQEQAKAHSWARRAPPDRTVVSPRCTLQPNAIQSTVHLAPNSPRSTRSSLTSDARVVPASRATRRTTAIWHLHLPQGSLSDNTDNKVKDTVVWDT